jgi:eukaryotic-like serine/threonine-protein kinase
VMDFGIARALHGASTTMTQTGMVMGTPQYLSPEQALGKAVDHRSDLYATGCLLYELLALRPPFVGETPLSVVYQHVQDVPVPPSQISGGEAPPELDGLVMRSLAKEPDDRFQTAEEMRGLVQYGLQMLYDQGGHTGTWNTGPVDTHEGRHTPAAGFAGTQVLPHPADGSGTTQIPQPILPAGYGGGDDGGFDGRGNKGSGRGKLWILAVLAVIAIAAGVALAFKSAGNGTHTGSDTKPTTHSKSTKDHSDSPTPSDDSSDQPTDTSTDNGSDTSSGGSGYTPSDPQTSQSQSTGPTDEPTDPQTSPSQSSDPTSGGTVGGTGDGGTDAGTGDGGTDTGTTNGGTDTGATNGGTDTGTTADGGGAGDPTS